MKRCSRCDRWLDRNAFSPNTRRRDGLQTYCRNCQRAYMREHYERNLEYYLAKAKRSKKKSVMARREQLVGMKLQPCADCGGIFPPWVMDFDHVRGEKLFNLSHSLKIGVARMLAEAAECDLVCANCHRQRTWGKQGQDPLVRGLNAVVEQPDAP